MRIVIDIDDETFVDHNAPVMCWSRAARYVRNVAAEIERGKDTSGVVGLTGHQVIGDRVHSAGWAVDSIPWQKSSLDNEEKV